MIAAIGAIEDLRGWAAMASNQTRPHPELTNGVAWMPVSLQQAPPPVASDVNLAPLGWLTGVALLGTGLILGGLLTSGVNDLRARNAENRATQASQALQANQRAIDTFCKGVSK